MKVLTEIELSEMEKRILEFFKEEHPMDFTIQEVSEKLDIHRNTASKYIHFLSRIGLLNRTRKIGMISFYAFNPEPTSSLKINENFIEE